jgi:UMF1 family MFS transporter
LGFEVTETLVMVLVVNVTAAFGAFGFGYVQDALGHKRALALTLLVWIVMAMLAANATALWLFWVSANLAGLAMGSSQSGGRAMVALFAPKRRLAEFYGVWNMALWMSAIVGPLTYGIVTWATGNDHRLAMMVTSGFFVVGLLTLLLINVERGKERANKTDRDELARASEKS